MSKHPVPLFPVDDKQRKMLPVYRQLTRYFPRAFREMTKVSVVNNVRYNPDKLPNEIDWARGKSPWQLDSALKHMMEHADGKVFDSVPAEVAEATGITRIYILAQAMWRISAELELLVEKTESDEAASNTLSAGPESQGQSAEDRIGEDGAWKPGPSPLKSDHQTVFCACGQEAFSIRPNDLLPTVIKNGETHSCVVCTDKTGTRLRIGSRTLS